MLNGFRSGSLIFLLSFLFFLLNLLPLYAADYNVPLAAYSICAEDLDLDGDIDIVVGHNYCSWTEWSGLSILDNNGNGEFSLLDTIYIYGGQTTLNIANIDSNTMPEIIAKHWNPDEQCAYLALTYNNLLSNIVYYTLNTSGGINSVDSGDVNADSFTDIVVASNNLQFWGILYNDGLGGLSLPEYYDVAHPGDIICGKLNSDNRDDIIVRSDSIYIFFSYESGFETYSIFGGGTDLEIADLDNDGDNDIIGTSNIFGGTGIYIYENIGNNEFLAHPSLAFDFFSTSLKLSDLNNDHLPDLVCAGSDNGFYTIMNEGDFTFLNPVFTSVQYYNEGTRRICCSDFDGNGYNDVALIRHIYITIPTNLTILFNDGNGDFVEEPQVGVNDNCILNIEDCELSNYPNPFNPSTEIRFQISDFSDIDSAEITIYNLKGQRVKSLECVNCFDAKARNSLSYSITWNGTDQNNQPVSSGIYFYRLKMGDVDLSRKCLLLK